ncbi:hypothetical protein Micr_00296 [Candidatus Micrarchaeum sp.]|jgi:hypothetical protein|uniref:hypothetical protein n=1 Tax=Candidatus Micrarchaeum sp. TaxID=2282148 RepID=UPI000AA7FA3A|nr:hypothetical protein [Candidatus Micrarchaeum sp.]QRF73777.1 hypothetical protein Micr_00296 [Candidatus Micrarchaeum sp.]
MEEKSETLGYDFSYPEFYPTNNALWLPTPKKRMSLFASVSSFMLNFLRRI